MSVLMSVGQRVETPLGPGEVISFETFVNSGAKSAEVHEDPGPYSYYPGRVRVRLDTPENCAAYASHGAPYFFHSEVTQV